MSKASSTCVVNAISLLLLSVVMTNEQRKGWGLHTCKNNAYCKGIYNEKLVKQEYKKCWRM